MILNKNSTSNYTSLREIAIHSSKFGLALSLCLPMQSAFACIQEGESKLSPFITGSGIIIFTALILASLGWEIRKIFPPKTNFFPLLLLASFLSSLTLAGLGAFVIPIFEEIFLSFGVNLPIQTQLLFSTRQSLFLPAIFGIPLWHFTKHNSNRSRIFSFALVIQIYIFLLVPWALYSPIFKMGAVY